MKSSLRSQIFSVLAFFDLFSYPLSKQEINNYILANSSSLEENLTTLITEKKIYCYNNFYTPQPQSNLIAERLKKDLLCQKYWQKINKIAPILASLPYVKMLAVCNNLALGTIDPESDIDLFIVTKKKRLFTTRFLITFWLHLLKMRRHGQKITGRFCLSFYVTDQKMDLSDFQISPVDIYLAYWTRNIQPVIGEKTYFNFININQIWLKKYFTQTFIPQTTHFYSPNKFIQNIKNIQEKILNTKAGDAIEGLLKAWQTSRANKKKKKLSSSSTNIIITDDVLKFHNIDHRADFYQQWKEKIKEVSS